MLLQSLKLFSSTNHVCYISTDRPRYCAHCSNGYILQSYLRIASSCLLPGGSRNEELALETLAKHSGNVQMALRDEIRIEPSFVSPLHSLTQKSGTDSMRLLILHLLAFRLIITDMQKNPKAKVRDIHVVFF